MTFWEQAAPHLFGLFAFNCCKTILGAGFVGHGMNLLAASADEDDDFYDAKADGEASSSSLTKPGNDGGYNKNGFATWFFHVLCNKYVRASATIGFGLIVALPAIASQTALEAMIPKVLVTDIGYDVATENVMEMLPDSLRKRVAGD